MIFVDANFIIYLIDNNSPERKQKCERFVTSRAQKGRILMTSTVVLGEVLVGQTAVQKQEITKRLNRLGIVVKPFGMVDAQVVEFDRDLRKSANLNRKKFKIDNMLFASARASQCSEIVTNDRDLIAISGGAHQSYIN